MTFRTTRTPKKKQAFIEALAKCGNVREACIVSGVPRQTVYGWQKSDAEFAQAWADALDEAADRMEREAFRRAVEGLNEPLTHNGQFTYVYTEKLDENGEVMCNQNGTPIMVPVRDEQGNKKIATVKKYSDTLLIFLLKAARPEKYRDRSETRHVGLTPEQAANLSDEELSAELKKRGLV